MKKFFNKAVLNGATVVGDGLTYPRIPNVYTGDNEGGYQRGDMMDANAVVEMIKELTDTGEITIEELQNLINEEIQERVEGDQDQQRYTDQKIKDLIGTSPETLDTLKEIADALGEDPDFAANVWEKLAEVDQTLEDYKRASNLPKYVVAEGMSPGTPPIILEQNSNGITLNVYHTDLDTGNIISVKTINAIPNATDSIPGLMSAIDKSKMDRIPFSLVTNMSVMQNDPSNIKIKYYRSSLTGSHWDDNINIKPATSSLAGAMSAADKTKLDSLVNYQAGNGIDITGDTISCTLDTSLYSIVTELPETGLPNKIYLLPSTKTEEGNVYTEYGYVDNKWEELGKYKADVDLSPYSRALNLPKHILGTDNSDSLIKILEDGENLKLRFLYKNSISGDQFSEYGIIPLVTNTTNGLISPSDKSKLDAIEAGAQVNTIESVSVNGNPLEITNKGVNIPIHEYTAGDGIKLENGKFSLDTLEHTERSYTTELIGPKEEPALNIPIVDESGKLNKNILIPNVADLFDRTPTEWTGEIDDLGCIRYEDYKRLDDYYYNFTKNVFFYPIQDNQLLMYNIGNGIDDDKLSDFLKNPNNYDNWNIPTAIYLSDGLLFDGGAYGEIPVHDPNDDSKTYYPGGVFGFKVNIDKSENNLLTFTEGEDYTDGFSPVMVNTKKLIVPKQSVIDTIVNSNEFKAKQDVLVSGDGINISEGVISTTPISIKTEKFSFINSGSHQPTYNYSGVTIYDDRYISGTKYGIAFDEADIKPRTTITSPDGVRTVCFALDQSVRRKIENAITSIKVNNVEQVNANGAVDLTIPNASITENGLMSKEDKAKLDSQPTIKASDATGVTDDDYVVIKKSEYQSILNRLSALENKA